MQGFSYHFVRPHCFENVTSKERASGLYQPSSALWLAPDQLRVFTLNDDEAVINSGKSIVAELRANMVRVDSDFSATPFKAKISNAGQQGKSPALSRRRLRLVIVGRDMEAGAVNVRFHHGGPQGARSKVRSWRIFWLQLASAALNIAG